MGLLSTEVEVTISNNVKYYENLGYEIPKYFDVNSKKHMVKRGTKILVKVLDLPINSHIPVDVECDNCNFHHQTEYRVYLKSLHENNIIYCRKCALSLLNSGCNHYKWDSNKTETERILQRHSLEYTKFIQRVLARDNYTCQCCKKEKTKDKCILEVHHLNGYDWCVEKRTDDTNGITLCETCHKNFHSLYGRGNNTKEQFEEWFCSSITLISCDIELQQARQIYCIEENKVYYSAYDLAAQWNLKGTGSIYDVCNRVVSSYSYKAKDGEIKTKYVNHYTVKGKHLIWYDEYLSQQNN